MTPIPTGRERTTRSRLPGGRSMVAVTLLAMACQPKPSEPARPNLQTLAREAADEFHVPYPLFLSLIYAESRFSLMDLGASERRGWVRLTLKQPFRNVGWVSGILQREP